MPEKKSEFLNIKANIRGLIMLLALIAIAGWYFGFTKDDVGDLAQSVVTMHKPDLPIEVKYRESMLGKGYVAIIKNTSKSNISVNITLRTSNQDQQKKSAVIAFEPLFEESIGWMEGWEFKSGDAITISHNEYQTSTFKIPSGS